jgi:hypothetical protein
MTATRHATLHSMTITEPRIRGRLEFIWKADGPTTPAAKALITHAKHHLEPFQVRRRKRG